MAEEHVKLSLIFDDPKMERSFQDSIGVSRKFRDSVVMVLGSVCFAKFYFQKMSFITPAQHVCWLFFTASFMSALLLTVGIVLGHPRILQWKPKLMPLNGVISSAALKLIAVPSIMTRGAGGSLWQLLPPECEILCKAQPDLRHWYQVIDDRISSLLGESASPIPVRGCMALRLFFQITVGGIIPILMAYLRELRERADFLKNKGLSIVQPTLCSHVHDFVLTCSILVMGAGCTAAVYMAFPEIYDVPMMLVEGQLH